MDIINELKKISNENQKIDLTQKNGELNRVEVINILKDVNALMFPLFYKNKRSVNLSREELLNSIKERLVAQLKNAYKFKGEENINCKEVCEKFLEQIPNVFEMLLKDIEALYDGDPAAVSREEIIITYPGFFAIMIYRVAHILYELNVPFIPRIMTEYAHMKTGVDINAGAKIGEYFFIDHATGIVIGETTTIGNNVKLYQGVTIGAKSFELDESGNPVKGIKRHPDIGNNVIIYANATILGGDTKIGDNCVIGGNVWITSSVESNQIVALKGLDMVYKENKQ